MGNFDLKNFESKIYNDCESFVVIGAYDGESHDTFFQRIMEKENKGNTIIFVEPVEKCFDKLLDKVNKLDEFNVICEKSAISNTTETVTMSSVKLDKMANYPWYIEGCSCVVENGEPINIYMKEVPNEDLDFETINTLTFDDLLGKYSLDNIDFLQIDTEGYDERILRSIDFSKYNIKFLKFELYYLSEGFLDEFRVQMDELGYSIYSDRDNCHFVKTSIVE